MIKLCRISFNFYLTSFDTYFFISHFIILQKIVPLSVFNQNLISLRFISILYDSIHQKLWIKSTTLLLVKIIILPFHHHPTNINLTSHEKELYFILKKKKRKNIILVSFSTQSYNTFHRSTGHVKCSMPADTWRNLVLLIQPPLDNRATPL